MCGSPPARRATPGTVRDSWGGTFKTNRNLLILSTVKASFDVERNFAGLRTHMCLIFLFTGIGVQSLTRIPRAPPIAQKRLRMRLTGR